MICKYIYCPKFIRIIWCGKYKITNEQFTDFDPDMYKELHADLSHLNTTEATEHFYKYGIYEG